MTAADRTEAPTIPAPASEWERAFEEEIATYLDGVWRDTKHIVEPNDFEGGE